MPIFSSSPSSEQIQEFKGLLRTYGDMAYRMAYQLTGGREAEARDLVQDVFVRIWRLWGKQRPASIKGWMYRVLQNLFLDSARRRARHPMVPLDFSTGHDFSLEDQLPDPEISQDAAIEKNDLQKQVTAALDQLDPDYRLAVVLCDMEGLAYEDIARILQCPIGTVRSRIHRGRLQLRALLALTQCLEVNS